MVSLVLKWEDLQVPSCDLSHKFSLKNVNIERNTENVSFGKPHNSKFCINYCNSVTIFHIPGIPTSVPKVCFLHFSETGEMSPLPLQYKFSPRLIGGIRSYKFTLISLVSQIESVFSEVRFSDF